AMQHNGRTQLHIDLIPLDPDQTSWESLGERLSDPESRQELIAQYPELAPIYEYRKDYPETVRVLEAEPRDASKGRGGRIAFAVRTSTLLTEPEAQEYLASR
ncbi:hypothetical protein KKF04_05470, partial [Patescibacteria group bacterium]|nr:hypothetical protein [Patescibacteria group bacterium]